ncbi:MAG: ribbon-helix-helix protein, CopG family [Candidatus Promineifilaceae bacterium]
MKRTTIMADAETLEKIERIAKREGKSKAAVIREALAEYIVEAEKVEPFENPLLSLIGLADIDVGEIDFSDGKDEEYLKEEWVKYLGRNL